MQIDDLTAGLSLSFLINLNTEQLQFESKILEVYPRRHTLLAQGVFTDDKIISFRGKGLVVDLIVTLPEDKPQLFKNVTTNVVKLSDGTLCYTVSSIAGSKTYNRRQSYRCYVGIETAVQCGLNRAAHDAIIKDISYNGFSVVSKEDLKLEVNQTVHAVLNDHMDETAENFNFHLYGLVARIQELENGLFLYGCRLDEITTLKTRVAKFKDFYGLFEQLREDADGLSVSELIDAIVKRTGYLQLLMAEGTDDALNRIQNIDEFVNKAAEYDKANPEGKLEGFLEEVALVADIDSYEEGEETVALMTLHSAKGLEFPYVFIIGMEEGIFPGFRAVMYGGEKEIEEERRLCYVGITRAKEELYLTHAKSRMQHGITQYNPPSRFLKEIPADLVDMPTRQISDMAKKYDAMTQNKPALGRKNVLPPTAKFGGVGMKKEMPAPKDFKLSYGVGDKVRAPKYGIGTVVSINNGGADFEVTVSFGAKGTKKFMARLSKLIKVSE